MSKTIEKIIFGVLIVAIIGVTTQIIAGTNNEKPQEIQISNNDQKPVSLEQAKTIALSITTGAITEAKITKENGVSVYEIEITNKNLETEVKIDPLNGNILSIQTDEEEQVTIEELEATDTITEEQAKEIALNEVPGKVIKIDLEKENDKLLYEVEIEDGNDIFEVEINAETGEVIEVEYGDDDEDND